MFNPMPRMFSLNDIMSLAEIKSGTPGWKATKWQAGGGDSIVTGSVPVGTYSRGPRKGEPKFTGPSTMVVVTRAELETAATAYEAETGRCWNCKGTGQVVRKISVTEGTTYRPCARCGGSGEVG
jgi:hypothetical protein